MSSKCILILVVLAPFWSILAEDKHKILFVAGKRSHGWMAHEHKAGCMLLAKKLNESPLNIDAQVVTEGWPKDDNVFEGAKSVVIYCDGGKRHVLNQHLKTFEEFAKKGVGLVCLHYGVETVKGEPGQAFLKWMGGYFETHWSVNPHWTANFNSLPKHPITRGVKPFSIHDEWYYHMRFQKGMKGVTPILSAHPPKKTAQRRNGPHSGNPHVRKAVEAGEIQHVAWAYERPDGGRGFGFTGGHFHKNWADDNFRKIVLNAIAWTAKLEIPENGIESKTPTQAELEENQDYPNRKPK